MTANGLHNMEVWRDISAQKLLLLIVFLKTETSQLYSPGFTLMSPKMGHCLLMYFHQKWNHKWSRHRETIGFVCFLTKRPANLREAEARFEVKGIQQSGLVWGQFLLHIPQAAPYFPVLYPPRVTSSSTAQRPSPKGHFLIYLAISLPGDPGDNLFLWQSLSVKLGLED